MNRRFKSLIVGCFLTFCFAALPISAQAGFGVRNFTTVARNEDGSLDLQAGSHPYEWTLSFEVAQNSSGSAEGTLRDLYVELPAGVVGNPFAVPRCTSLQFDAEVTPKCPPSTQIGIAHVTQEGEPSSNFIGLPVYNLVPPTGAPARFGFSLTEQISRQDASLRSSGDFGVNVSDTSVPINKPLLFVSESIWGVPALAGHDSQRGLAAEAAQGEVRPPVRSEGPLLPFFTLPTSCRAPLATTIQIDSTQNPGIFSTATAFSEEGGAPVELAGCRLLPFKPTIRSRATTSASDSPSGLNVQIHQPQNELPQGLSSAHLKDVKLSLPPGMALNPSAANGLAACSVAQVGYRGTEEGGLRFTAVPQTCPNASKVGSVEVKSPLVDHQLAGSLYLAKPYENPFGSLLAVYLIVEDEQTGVIVKLAGKVEPDPQTGQLTTSFTNNPQLPIEDIDVSLFEGATAALKTPLPCGTDTTNALLTPWSTPEGASVSLSDSFGTSVAAGGSGSCPSSEAAAPNTPSFTAGTLSPQAGSYSPFLLHLGRADGSQHLTGIDTTLPEGLVGKLAGIPYCSEAQIAVARSRESPNGGATEQASPSCPAASEVGTVTIGAGAGPRPFYASGHAYLAGRYKGAPLSLEIITPAVAGPFDLGTVAVRAALYVNQTTAQIHAVSDPLPTIIQGIPLDIRSVDLNLGRSRFTLNPTSCEPKQITGAATAQTGQVAQLQSRFQVGGCEGLKFKPKLALRVFGKTNRNAKPRFRAVLQTKPGEANIARAQVNLPHSEFLEQAHIKTICTRAQFNAGAGYGEHCPKGSIYGQAKAFTPLLDKPLTGPVYLRSSSHKLPDLVAALGGQIDIALAGKVDSGPNQGIRNTFEVVPDAPVSKFILELKGGGQGLLVNSENLCSKHAKSAGIARFTGQNGKVESFKPKVANNCGGGNGPQHGKRKG